MKEDQTLLRMVMLMDLPSFAQRALQEILPGVDVKWNWHLDVVCSKLSDLANGKVQRLLICVPPRSLKSLLCSIIYPAWLLARDASETILCVSYAQSLSEDFARQCRRLIESGFYQSAFDTRLAPDRRAAEQFETTRGGGRIASSVGGTITGRGGKYIIVDDPMKPEEAHSEVQRTSTLEWVRSTLATRSNDKLSEKQLLIMQRLHEEDVAGLFLAEGGWEALILPAVAIEEETYNYVVAGRPVTHRRAVNEVLHPEREPLEILERLRRTMGSLHFEAQYQQRPVPIDGNLMKRSWFGRYGPADVVGLDRIIQSWDTASKPGAVHDYSSCTTWGLKNGKIFLLDVWRGKLEMPELIRKVIELSDRYKPERILVEDKGSGTALLQALRARYFYKAVPFLPKLDKLSRFASVAPTIEGGHVYLPQAAPWLDDYLQELCAFPTGRNDDQVDSTSQALHWLNEQRSVGGLHEYYRQAHRRMLAAVSDRTVHLRAPHGISHVGLLNGETVPIGPDGAIWVTRCDAGPLMGSGFIELT